MIVTTLKNNPELYLRKGYIVKQTTLLNNCIC